MDFIAEKIQEAKDDIRTAILNEIDLEAARTALVRLIARNSDSDNAKSRAALEALITEATKLIEQGIPVFDRLRISPNCPLILPSHVALDRARELASGANAIGTTGRGIGPAYEDKVGRRALRVVDLNDLASLPAKIDRLLAHHNALRRGVGADEIDAAALLKSLKEIAPKILPFVGSSWRELEAARLAGKRILFEGAQAVLLDIDHGTFPFVTSSNSSGVGVASGSGVPGRWITKVIGVLKAYSTRVGGGPFPTEQDNAIGQHIRDRGNEYGTVTRRPRRCGPR